MKLDGRTALAVTTVAFGLTAAQSSARASDEMAHHVYAIAGQQVPTDVVAEQTVASPRTARSTARAAVPASAYPVRIDLPDTWSCGESSGDDAADALSNAPAIKVLYAYTTDRGDHFAEWANTIQQAVERSMNIVASASPDGSMSNGKTLRYDLGTPCDPQQVDIRVVALPQPSSYYGTDTTTLYNQLRPQILAVTGTPAPANQIVWVDGLSNVVGSGVAGNPSDETPGDRNPAQIGGQIGFLFPSNGPSDPFNAAAMGANPVDVASGVMTHEVLHMLGGVGDHAPNPAPLHHTDQRDDIMFRAPSFGGGIDCGDSASNNIDGFRETDCGGEDYWNPNPAPGSYLATHWNLADSAHLCPINRCAMMSRAPYARITSDPQSSADIGQRVTFDASSSADPDGDQIVRYQWDFDNDGLFDAEGPAPSTSYASPGTATVRLRVTDATGEIGVQSRTLTIGSPTTPAPSPNPGPQPIFNAVPSNPQQDASPQPGPWGFDLDRTPTKQTWKAVQRYGLNITGTATRSGNIDLTLKLGASPCGSARIAAIGGVFSRSVKLSAQTKKKIRAKLKKKGNQKVTLAVSAYGSGIRDLATVTITG